MWIRTHRDNGKEGGLNRRGGDRSTTRHKEKERAGAKLSSWPEIGSDGDVLLTPYVPKGITGHDDDDDVFMCLYYSHIISPNIIGSCNGDRLHSL